MSFNSVYYWRNFLEKDIEQGVRPDSYILNFHVVNQNSNVVFYKWYSFRSKEELLGFIKFVVLPSGYYSRIIGEKDDDVVVGADTYQGTMDILCDNLIRVDEKLINYFNEDYSILEVVEKEFSLEQLQKFCESFNSHLDYKGIVFSSIEVHENIKELGRALIRDYEEQGMINELERQMDMTKEQIEEMFANIQDNPFMLRKINKFLDSKFLM